MKKIILTFLVCLTILSSILFVGCEKVEKRKIANFYSSYLEVADQKENLTTTNIPQKFNSPTPKQCVTFVYSDKLSDAMIMSPYKEIDTVYNTLLDDIMGPTYLYSSAIVNAKISNKEKKELFEKLDSVKNGYIEVSERLGDLERILTENDLNANSSKVALSNLFSSYEGLLDNATRLSKQIYSIYFFKVMKNSNPDYLKLDEKNIDLKDLATLALNKKIYFLSVYADIYLHLNIIGRNAPQIIVNGNSLESYSPYKTLSDKTYNSTLSSNIEGKRSYIVENARAMQLIQNDFEALYTKYQNCISKINYAIVNDTSSEAEKGYKLIIDSFTSETGIVYNSCNTLINILDACFA